MWGLSLLAENRKRLGETDANARSSVFTEKIVLCGFNFGRSKNLCRAPLDGVAYVADWAAADWAAVDWAINDCTTTDRSQGRDNRHEVAVAGILMRTGGGA